MGARIRYDQEAVAEFCRRHNIRKLSFFGSVIRDDFTDKSDVDVLVEFEPGKTPGLAYFALGDELAKIIGRRVDLNTAEELSRYYRDEVLREAQTVYAAA